MNIQGNGNAGAPAGGGISLNRGAAPASGGGISLSKGQKVSLTKDNPTLDNIKVGLGWDTNGFVGQSYDLDAQAFLLLATGQVKDDAHFIFYNQATSPDGAIRHTGDNKTGDGVGDDETIEISLQNVSADIQKVAFTVTIHDAIQRAQSFGQVQNAYIRIVDTSTNQELIRYDLTEDFSIETALVVGELYRHNGEWKFNAVGAGYQDTLADFCGRYGVNLA